MAKQVIGIGTLPNDGTGDDLRTTGTKINEMMDDQYNPESTQYTTTEANPSHSEGLVFYDNTKKSLSYYNDESDTTVNLGQELIVKVYNNNGAIITNGTAVRLSGTVVSGIPTVVRALADTEANANAVGVATHDIAINDTGYITVWGTLGGVDTSSFTIGDILFVSATVAGELTNVEQPILKPIGLVLTQDVLDGQIVVAQKPIINITAIGQVGALASATQAISTTPEAVEIYQNTSLLEQNTTITQTGSSPYTAKIEPSSIGASGFYRVAFAATIESTTNAVFFFEIYTSGASTGILGAIDLSNNNIDSGSTSFNAVTTQVIDNTEDIEIYVYSDSGTPTYTCESAVFNIERIGNI
ncbi:MAG: hypothetical protein KUG81_09865 [Gammaproteobacteria bacterium]|nr:hypothetical protein [Gammaproteobacteria bacterium]